MQDSSKHARQQQWQSILQMTEQLQQLSAEQNWQAVTELESQRFSHLQDFFSTQVEPDEAENVAAGIRKMLKSDALLVERSIGQKQDISDNVRKMINAKQAIKAYGEI